MDHLLWPGSVKSKMAFDFDKFKQLVHYVIWKAGKRDWFGATKLNKVLWFADVRVYTLTGKPITGAVYIREKHGPVPRAMMPVRGELEREGTIRIVREGKLDRFTTSIPPDMSAFLPDEMKAVDYWIEHIASEHTAESISEKSHDYVWEIAAMGEEIPMFAAFANRIREEPGKDAMQWGLETARRLGLV
jgi:hypothetical protein